MKIVSCKEAHSRGLKRYFTGSPCPRGHISERFVSDRGCCLCKAENNLLLRNKKCRARYQSEHRDQQNEYERNWYLGGGNEVKTKWRSDNPARVTNYSATRRARKLQATPAWADLKTIQAIYEECERRNQATGVKHVVDHVIPLQGERVSGLHVAENLQVLTEEENLKKSNKLVY